MASFTLVVQDREVRRFELTAAVTTIGRAQDNDIVINNLALSRRHAEIHRRATGFEVLDRGSQNGVFVNDERIEGPRPLRNSDVVTLGTYAFVFHADNEDEDEDEPSSPWAQSERQDVEDASSEDPTPPPARVEPATPPPQLVPGPAPMAVLSYQGLEIQRVPLEAEECQVGRAQECDIQITERRLSRRHCLLYRDPEHRWFVKDLGSQNGTYVNRQRVREAQQLRHGDELNFADYKVLFVADAAGWKNERDASRASATPSARPGIEKEKTELPEAWSDASEVSAPPGPVVSEPPRIRRSRRSAEARGPAPTPERPTRPKGRRPRPSASRAPGVEVRGVATSEPFTGLDVPDMEGEKPRPDPSLDEWYAARSENDEQEEPSVLLERSISSMSQVLSTMMVDKRELDRNLEVARRGRQYSVRVEWNREVLFDGLLEREVTVLGTDSEADLALR
ncbi:MAG: FHA domain-containing protein, partial [Myxococcota bacterium]